VAQAISELIRQIGADGINGDTQDGVPLTFSEAAERVGHHLAFEPEGSPSDEALAWNVGTWRQYAGQFGHAPGVNRFCWLETQHMVNISYRCNRTKTDDLQWRKLESWENICGFWNDITPQDGEATRVRVRSMDRRCGQS
jgi:iron(II)-dependent oxidoreductase